jgi:heme exporter protein A
VIELTNCSKEYGGSLVIKSVSLSISKPGLVLMLGGNGAGKSTLLKMMSGILQPSAGQISISLPVAYLGHDLMLYPQLSVKENLELFCKLGLVDGHKLEEAYLEFELDSLKFNLVSTLSQGQKARVNLARVFSLIDKSLTERGAILLDEATTALDVKWRQKVADKIKAISVQRPVVFVTHDPKAYYELANRVIFLDQARLIYDQSIDPQSYNEIDRLYMDSLR